MNISSSGAPILILAVIGLATTPCLAQSYETPFAFVLECSDSEDIPAGSAGSWPKRILCEIVDDAGPVPLGNADGLLTDPSSGGILMGRSAWKALKSLGYYLLTNPPESTRWDATLQGPRSRSPRPASRLDRTDKTRTATGNPGGGFASGRNR